MSMKRNRSVSNVEFAANSTQPRLPPAQRNAPAVAPAQRNAPAVACARTRVINEVMNFPEFLTSCNACNIKFDDTMPIYMCTYRDFGAYCSEECRGPIAAFNEAVEEAKDAAAMNGNAAANTSTFTGKVIWEF